MELLKVGITMGDPAGIGAEIIAKATSHRQIKKICRISVIGDKWVFDKVKGRASGPKDFQFIDLRNVAHKNFKFGRVKAQYGRASIEYLQKAVELVRKRQIDCLVTAPISKLAINLAGYKYNGHTEFLAQVFRKKKQDLVMMLLNRYLKISLVTRHIALKKLSPALSREQIYKTILVTYNALSSYFAIAQPRICAAALNPHAGEGGLLGMEEIELICPAVKRAAKSIIGISGPLPADSAFSAARQGQFDAVIAMYHDQALIPLKILDCESGVNLTLGLNFVRTSPLHGTGFDIAGKNIAGCGSLTAAIKTALECTWSLRKKDV